MPVRLGIIGKTNTGKTTFFNAATLQSQEVSTYPFTTKAPNIGTGYALTPCVHREFNVADSPRNSACVDGWRHVPVEIIDLPGLVKGAWIGKGLGNQFLSVASQSDALLHVVDASGSVDAEGRITEPGMGDPVADVLDVEEELAMWYMKLIEGNREKISRITKSGSEVPAALEEVLAGAGIKAAHVAAAAKESGLLDTEFDGWTEDDLKKFAWTVRDVSKPTLIVANKMDLPYSAENFKRLRDELKDMIVVPASSEAELTLRRAEQKGFIRYLPGEERFSILDRSKLNERQMWALNYIRRTIFGEYMRTGVQFAVNVCVFKLLRMNTVYPVSDPSKLTDTRGNVLPDLYLMPNGAVVEDLARQIHTELAKGLLYAIDVRSMLRLPKDYQLKDRDILSIVSTFRKGA